MITVLDYGAGNVRSVINAIEKLGETVRLVNSPEDILSADRLVFPGVGSFGSMMAALHDRGYAEALVNYLQADRPFLGVCLGLQALFEKSEEAPGIRGLGVIPGTVKRFDIALSVPHIGWNGIHVRKPSRVFDGIVGDEKFYFVHSYYAAPQDMETALTLTDYGVRFVSAVQKGNLIATQFHPEKSGAAGLKLLGNFLKLKNPAIIPAQNPKTTRLAKRIVACLDVRADDAGKPVVTKGDQYDVREKGKVRDLGDPVDLARRYYEEGADEIAFLNITGFREFPLEDLPMLRLLEETSRHVFVPLTIGGGIQAHVGRDGRPRSSLEVASAYFRSGADKVSIGSDAVRIAENYLKTEKKTGQSAIEQISAVYGSQAVVISIDPRRVYVSDPGKTAQHVIETAISGPNGEHYCWFQCTVKGGREGRPMDAVTLARVCETLGAGEILLNSIDKDGTRSGFDIELIRAVAEAVSIPVIASSGAGRAEHFLEVFSQTDAEAALAAGILHRKELSIGAVKKYLLGRVEIRP